MNQSHGTFKMMSEKQREIKFLNKAIKPIVTHSIPYAGPFSDWRCLSNQLTAFQWELSLLPPSCDWGSSAAEFLDSYSLHPPVIYDTGLVVS